MSDTTDPRVYTPDEVRDELLEHICIMVDYWDKVSPDKRDAMEGLAFSILSTLDGCGPLPAFLVTPMAHPDDKAYHQEQGENWYPEDQPDLGMLHEFFHKAMKKWRGKNGG